MPRKAGSSAKAQRDQVRERMRGYGCTVAQIAVEMARRFGLRPRVAWRHALGWAQWKLAQEYNTRHPGAKVADNRISEYEAWPHGGSPPSLRYLANLAATFGNGCTPAQLVDADDLDKLTPAERLLLTSGQPLPTEASADLTPRTPRRRRGAQALLLPAAEPPGGLVVPTEPTGWAWEMGPQPPGELVRLLMTCLGPLMMADSEVFATARGRDDAYHRLVQFLLSWAHTMKRRHALRALGWAASVASVGHLLDPDEQERIAMVLDIPGRVDRPIIEHVDAVLSHCERLDDVLGPRAVLDTVLAQRDLARSLVPRCPEKLRPYLLSVLSNASRQAAWLSFDSNDLTGATYYYDDARVLAHEAGNIGLGAVVLCGMSHLATWRGRPRIGIDHAVAAGQWAGHTDDLRLRAYCADMAAKAYSRDGQRDECIRSLDAAEALVTHAGEQRSDFVSFYGVGAHTLNGGQCQFTLGDAPRAAEYARQALVALDPSFTRLVAFTSVTLGRAYGQCGEVEEAARLLGEAGEIAAGTSSARLVERLTQARVELQPWADTAAVRALDERLASCGVA